MNWGFDTKALDQKTRPQDDFFRYAGGGWLDKNPIPPNESRWGSFMILRYETDKQLYMILKELENTRAAKDSPERLIRDFFRSGQDMKRRNAQGLTPITPLLNSIEEAKKLSSILDILADLHKADVGALFGAAVDQDSKESTKYILHLYQDGLGLPDRDYYLKDDAESKRIRDAYVPYVEGLFRLMGRKHAQAAAKTVLAIETRLAKASMTKEDRRDADKTYNKKTLASLQKLSPAIDWKRYFKRIGAREPESVIAMQPEFFAEVSRVLRETPLEDLKTYLSFHAVNDYAPYFSTKFVNHHFSFYGKVLTGLKVQKPLWRRTLSAVNACLGEQLGKIYVKKHFPPRAKRKMDELVDDLFEVYEARLKSLDWMSAATKKKALRKLAAMNRKIGYPKRWKSYLGLAIRPDDFAGNIARAAIFENAREMRKLRKSIDREEWFMFPQTVNAYFAPNLNDIVFPAAILQPPFFDLEADDALNYGSIGSVIGHEITHGFDDQGSKYDEHGNLRSWWTKEDRKRFEKYAKIIEEQYSGYEVADGVKVSGKLTLGENIADLGGIAIAYDAYLRRLEKTGRKDIDGFTPEQRFFLGVSLFEREHSRPEFQKMAVLTDPHSPAKFRINGPLSNMDAFYASFGVKEGDKLYRPKKVRTTVW